MIWITNFPSNLHYSYITQYPSKKKIIKSTSIYITYNMVKEEDRMYVHVNHG